MYKQINKIITRNDLIEKLINTSIYEYDIENAGPTALRMIKGDLFYNKLMKIKNKHERDVYVGKMMLKDKTLYKKIDALFLKWINEFLRDNKITKQKFIESNRDSVMFYNKIPVKTIFENGIVKFRTKGEKYSSMFRINNKLFLFDGYTHRLRVKGLNDNIVDDSAFVSNIIKPLMIDLEKAVINNKNNLYKLFSKYRSIYINSDMKIEMYRSLDDGLFHYTNDAGNDVNSESYIKENDYLFLQKHLNLTNYLIPLFNMN